MTEADPDIILDDAPTADDIDQFRAQAEDRDDSFIAAFRNAEGEERYLVVSPRGTCVILDENYSEDSFNPSKSADEVAAAIAG